MKKLLTLLILIIVFIFIYIFIKPNRQELQKSSTYHIGLLNPSTVTGIYPPKAIASNEIFLINLIYDRLFWVDTTDNLIPDLVKTYGHDSTYSNWFIVIKKGRYFHLDGSPVTADIVAKSIEASMKYPSYGQVLLASLLKGASNFLKGKTKHVAGLEVRGDTIFFHLNKPFRFLLYRLATTFYVPVWKPGSTSINPWTDRGSGPFKLLKREPQTNSFVLVRDKNWNGKKFSNVDTLYIHFYSNLSLLLNDVKNGIIDIAYPEYSSINLLNKSNYMKKNYEIRFYPSVTIYLLFLNLNNPLIKSLNLRQKIEKSLDRREIVNYLGGGFPLCDPVPYKFQLDNSCNKSKLVKKFQVDKEIKLINGGSDIERKISNIVVNQLEQHGFKIKYTANTPDFLQKVIHGKYQIALTYYGPFISVPEPYLWLYLSTNIPVPNISRIKNQRIDQLYMKYVESGKNKYYQEILKIIRKEIPVIPIVQSVEPVIKRQGVSVYVDGSVLPHF